MSQIATSSFILQLQDSKTLVLFNGLHYSVAMNQPGHLLVCFITYRPSCFLSKEDERQVCSKETQASFTVHNFNEFVDLNSKAKENGVFYSSSYLGPLPNEPMASNSWSAKVALAGICNTDVPNIKFSVELKDPKPYLEIRGNVQENNLYATSTLIKLTSIDGIHF